MAIEGQQPRWVWFLRKRAALILLLWLLFAQALGAARAASITFDEGPHLAVGYATLSSGDLRLQPVHIHPPLANLLAAAPLLLDPDLPDPRMIPGWEIASLSAVTDAVVWQYPHPARLALAGRLPIILLTLFTGALVWRWAADLGGEKAGLLALALYTFDPNIVAHGSLITTDMAVTAFGLAAFFLLHRYLRHPVAERSERYRSRALLVGAGLALGLALASKVSAVLLVLLVGVVLFAETGLRLVADRRERHLVADPRRGAHHAHRQGARATPPRWGGARGGELRAWLIAAGVPFIGISLIAAVTLWAVYGFELRSLPGVTGAIPLPAATHLEIYRSLQEHYRLGHPAFLMGQNSDQGWWYYFPVALGVKTPLPILILLGLALILFVRRPRSMNLALVLFPPVYMITALFSSVDIGYRHLLPMLPFIHIFIGSMLYSPYSASASRLGKYLAPSTQRTARIALYALLLWLVVGTAVVYPYPLTFFNKVAGGPEGGYRWLVDSNLDWGQNLWQLRDWMRMEGPAQRPEHTGRMGGVLYSHFSPARPELYGVSADWLPPDPRAVPFAPFDPAPGVYAIGATTLQGVYTPDVNTFAFFRARQPDAILGHALFLYRVPEHPVPDWVAVCFDVPLNDRQIRANFGRPDLRLIFFDCNQSQVYATGEEGRFLLPPGASWPDGANLVLQARYADGRPVFTLLHSQERPMPETAAEPVSVDGPLSFLGYELDQAQVPGDAQVVLRTWWRVDWVPDRPLSIMAHLSGPDGALVAVGDGLGVPVEGWQPGDRILQIHRLPLPPDAPAGDYTLHTGGYWLDTLERWPIRLADGTSSDHITLDKITVLD